MKLDINDELIKIEYKGNGKVQVEELYNYGLLININQFKIAIIFFGATCMC